MVTTETMRELGQAAEELLKERGPKYNMSSHEAEVKLRELQKEESMESRYVAARRIRLVVTVITEKTRITAARKAKPACCKVISIFVYFFTNVEPSRLSRRTSFSRVNTACSNFVSNSMAPCGQLRTQSWQ